MQGQYIGRRKSVTDQLTYKTKGLTDRPTDKHTNGPTNRPTDIHSLIAPAHITAVTKKNDFFQFFFGIKQHHPCPYATSPLPTVYLSICCDHWLKTWFKLSSNVVVCCRVSDFAFKNSVRSIVVAIFF